MKTLRTVLAIAFGLVTVASAIQAQGTPRLVVMLVVDQMRADYVDRFNKDWTGGLKRLVSNGAWFRRAAYPYLTTVTCAGHATISTGACTSSVSACATSSMCRPEPTSTARLR